MPAPAAAGRAARLALFFAVAAAAAVAPAVGAWHQCAAQSAFGGAYGFQAIANLSDFRTGLIRCAGRPGRRVAGESLQRRPEQLQPPPIPTRSAIWPYVVDASKEAEGWKRFDAFNPFIAW
jgi:hypothetical protein